MKLKVADLIFDIEVKGSMLSSRVGRYEYKGEEESNFTFTKIPHEFYNMKSEDDKNITYDEAEYLYSGTFFYEQLTNYHGVMLHASCVEYEGKAYLFSAPSGTGKSTHTHLWLKYLKGARIVNDDKPAIRCIDGVFYAYGTPWSGKTDESINEGFPIAGICFLQRGENEIKRVSGIKALKYFMDQTVRPANKERMLKTMDIVNEILTQVPIYEMTCDISREAVMSAYEGMKNA